MIYYILSSSLTIHHYENNTNCSIDHSGIADSGDLIAK